MSLLHFLYRSSSALEVVPVGWGYVAIFGLTVAFATMYLPVKKYDTGNGMVFQWLLCISLTSVLFGIHICIGSPKIWAFTLLSGIFWSTGNVTVVPIIKRLGMGVGMLIWSMVGLVMSWASFRFGWFGIKPEEPKNNTLNIIGVIFAALSVIVFALIRPTSATHQSRRTSVTDTEVPHATEQIVTESTGDVDPLLQQQPVSFIRRFWASRIVQRLIGVALSAIAGILYGIVWIPIFYVQEHYENASKRGIDYVAPLGLGAFMGSTTYLVLYMLVLQIRNKLTNSNENLESDRVMGKTPFMVLFLPSILAGALCGIGQACGLVAAEALQPAITSPIAGTLPGALATLIGTLFYREVQGTRNYITLAVALSCAATGSILTGLSK